MYKYMNICMKSPILYGPIRAFMLPPFLPYHLHVRLVANPHSRLEFLTDYTHTWMNVAHCPSGIPFLWRAVIASPRA
jgi:hypothetical protein